METHKERHRSHANVVSATRGRLRIKLHSVDRNLEAMEGIQTGLNRQQGIDDVRLNPSTGSITVRYNHGRHSTDSVLGLMRDLDVMIQSVGHVPVIGESVSSNGKGGDSVGFLEAIADLNRRISDSTGVPVDLKVLFPLALAGAGIWSIAKRGLMIESVPGWLFLWFAFDMFVKFHPTPR